jgi:toxin ParE1/3/4
MRRVVWQPEALADFDSQIAFIAERSMQGAMLVADRIETAVEQLRLNPIGRPGRVGGTYERSIAKTSHIVVFAFTPGEDALSILRIIHTSRDWPQGSWPEE